MSSVLVTGGTGTLGSKIVEDLLAGIDHRVIVYSRDEFKQVEMRRRLDDLDGRVRWFIGDVRDESRLRRAMRGVHAVIHCAAMKNLEATEYNPLETIRTNIHGTANVINAAIDAGVDRILAISTDKAVNPSSLYGATKLTMEHLITASRVYAPECRMSVIRFGNFWGSRGSVIPHWKRRAAEGQIIPITDKRMIRWWIDVDDASAACLEAMRRMKGGEVFVPTSMVCRPILEVARQVCGEDAKFVEIGSRPGEKIREEIFTDDELERRELDGDFWLVRT